jgi:hypothetical protein
MIEMLRIYSKGFLENVTIEELPPYSIHHAGQYSSATTTPRTKPTMMNSQD